MLQIGDKLPEFKGFNQNGEIVNSADYKGKKLVIFFYPQASTPTCTVEVCQLRDHYELLQKEGFQLLGISGDSVAKQKKFHSRNSLPYDLLADEERNVIEQFGVWKEKKTFGKTYMGVVRTTFVFNEEGICTKVIEKVKSKEAAQQILEEI